MTTYKRDGKKTRPTIRGLAGVWGLAVDVNGKIYVANRGNNTITTYKADGTQTTPTITGPAEGLGASRSTRTARSTSATGTTV